MAADGYDPYATYEDRILMLSDYWTADIDTLYAGLVDAPVSKFVGAPQAFLTNGKTIATNCSAPDTRYASLDVQQGQTYRLRLVGATSLFAVHFRIPQHKLKLVELEGTYVVPTTLDYIEVLPGQRMSLLVTADQPVDNYWMQMTGKWRLNPPTNGFSVLHYTGAGDPPATPPALLPAINETVGWQEQFSPLDDQATTIPPASAPPVLVNGTQVVWGVNGTLRRWAINGIVYEDYHHSTLLEDVIASTVSSRPVGARPKAYFKTGQVVDIVLQNNVALSGVCEMHPWHLHGHSFWVVNSGAGNYDPSSVASDRTIAVKRDIVAVYPHHAAYNQPGGTPGTGCGWAKIRFVANNVGAWALHCHIASHFAMGMAAAFVVGEDSLHDPAFVEHLRCQSAGYRCQC
ncbi:hypothetical protein, variant [Aphanomyces invadans]|uniref:Plastocyanin-like domain-containing protein n=1 Tax=Aphanomyces invadans TaxID=157072 RepID=A0A024TVJ8_9STRA|nr:hypothetical protein, variant [Aphanomyces invadans]ETV97999.1 hypothetical protein, variant [Aphanomyces invadans]|eukprot:XP_008873560.1 hypothetical protein, variant [Aphanomyces invadans]